MVMFCLVIAPSSEETLNQQLVFGIRRRIWKKREKEKKKKIESKKKEEKSMRNGRESGRWIPERNEKQKRPFKKKESESKKKGYPRYKKKEELERKESV